MSKKTVKPKSKKSTKEIREPWQLNEALSINVDSYFMIIPNQNHILNGNLLFSKTLSYNITFPETEYNNYVISQFTGTNLMNSLISIDYNKIFPAFPIERENLESKIYDHNCEDIIIKQDGGAQIFWDFVHDEHGGNTEYEYFDTQCYYHNYMAIALPISYNVVKQFYNNKGIYSCTVIDLETSGYFGIVFCRFNNPDKFRNFGIDETKLKGVCMPWSCDRADITKIFMKYEI